MAKLLRAAKVIATVSSVEKAEHARAAGADIIINYRTESVPDQSARLCYRPTAGKGWRPLDDSNVRTRLCQSRTALIHRLRRLSEENFICSSVLDLGSRTISDLQRLARTTRLVACGPTF